MTSEKRIAILQNTGVIDMRERNLNSELVGEIAAEIMHVSRQLVQRGVRAMGNLDIGIGQLPVLKLLSDNGAMTQGALAEEMHVTPATISGTVRRMERSGLICRTPAEMDGRSLYVSLTEKGRARCGEAVAAMELPYDEMFAGFSEDECRLARDFVHRMAENLSRETEESGE